MRDFRAEPQRSPTERAHAAPPASFGAKYATLLHGRATPRHAVLALVCRTADIGANVGQPFWGCPLIPERRAGTPHTRLLLRKPGKDRKFQADGGNSVGYLAFNHFST